MVLGGKMRMDKTVPKVSVVIPAYNAGKTIERCVKSIANQSYKNCEIILVDDGSETESADEYQKLKTDYGVTVLRQKNSGAAVARNAGIKSATGDYLIFVDADDYWNGSEFLEKLVSTAEEKNADVTLFYFLQYDLRTGKVSDRNVCLDAEKACGNLNGEKIRYLLSNCYNIISPCSKLIRRSLIIKYGIFFPEGRLREDIDWSLRLLLAASSFQVLPEKGYVRTIQENSTSRTITVRDCNDLIWLIEKWTDACAKMKDKTCAEGVMGMVAYQYYIAMGFSSMLSTHEKKETQAKLRQMKGVIKYSNTRKTKACYMLTLVAPFDIASYVIGRYLNR